MTLGEAKGDLDSVMIPISSIDFICFRISTRSVCEDLYGGKLNGLLSPMFICKVCNDVRPNLLSLKAIMSLNWLRSARSLFFLFVSSSSSTDMSPYSR